MALNFLDEIKCFTFKCFALCTIQKSFVGVSTSQVLSMYLDYRAHVWLEKFLWVGYGIHNVRFILWLSIGWRLFFPLTADMWCFCSHLPQVLHWSSFWWWIQWATTLSVVCSKLYTRLSRHERWACFINKGLCLSLMMHQNPKDLKAWWVGF